MLNSTSDQPTPPAKSMAIDHVNNLENLIKAWMEDYIERQRKLGKPVNYEASINGFYKVTGIPQPTLWKLIQEDYQRLPSREMINRLCEILGCTLNDMYVQVYVPPNQRKEDDGDD